MSLSESNTSQNLKPTNLIPTSWKECRRIFYYMRDEGIRREGVCPLTVRLPQTEGVFIVEPGEDGLLMSEIEEVLTQSP